MNFHATQAARATIIGDGQEVSSTTSSSTRSTTILGGVPITITGIQTTTQYFAYAADGNLATVRVAQTSAVGTNGTIPTPPALPAFSASVLQASDTRDALGRVLLQNEYDTTAEGSYSSYGTAATYSTPGTVILSQSNSFNNDSQTTQSTVAAIQLNTSAGTMSNTVTTTSYNYGVAVASGSTASATSYADGNVINQVQNSTTYTGATGTSSPSGTTVNTSNSYLWFDSAWQGSITAAYSYSGTTGGTNTSTFSYDHNGHVSEVQTTGTNAHTNVYTTSAAGMVMENQETLSSGGSSAPETFYFYFNDEMIGQIGNNGTTNVNYTTSVDNQTTTTSNPGAFANGATTGTSSANFDENYYAINATGNGEGSASGGYTVQSGDTLQSIAANMYGDANLWYVIANANGLDASSTLSAGTVLTIPNTVENAGNTSSTFKPYNANAALGDVQPGAPVPPAQSGGGCGSFGQILMALVAVAVAVVVATVPVVGDALDASFGGMLFGEGAALGEVGTDIAVGAIAGIAGNVASQGLGLAIGEQSSFNWGSLGMAAISGAVGGTVSTSGIFDNLPSVLDDGLTAVTSNIVSQGIGVATGLQNSFDWAGVAGAAAGAIVSGALSREFTGDPDFQTNGEGKLVPTNPGYGPENFGQSLVSGMAGDIVNAASRSVLAGTDFGSNLIAALPDAIGNTIGNAVAQGIEQSTQAPATTGNASIGMGPGWVQDANGSWFNQGAANAAGDRIFAYSQATLLYESPQDAQLLGADAGTVAVLQQRDVLAQQAFQASLAAQLTPSSGGGLQSAVGQSLFSGPSSYAMSYFELNQRDASFAALVAANNASPTTAQALDISTLGPALANNRQMLDAAYAQADSQIYQTGAYISAVPVAGALAGVGVGAAGLYGATVLVRSGIGAVTNVAVDASTSYLTGNWQSFTLTSVGSDVVVGGLMGVPNPEGLLGEVLAAPQVGLPLAAGAVEISNQLINNHTVELPTFLKNSATLGIFHF